MKKLFFILFVFITCFSQNIYVVKIDQEIEPGLAQYIKRIVKEAENNRAEAIIFEINTFGGRVDAAVTIRDAIINSKVLTVGFVNKRAISAGALITIACKKIIMADASTMGAATVVDMEGKKQSEKYQSYMRAEMRATAEKNGRNPIFAEAMVDETVILPDSIKKNDKLLTLTNAEAHKYGYNDTTLNSINEILKYLNIKNPQLIDTQKSNTDKIISFLSNPIVVSILMMIGIIGIITEIKTPGFGAPGIIGLLALGLLFGVNYITDLATSLELILLIIGLILILVEIFVIPGFGVTGVIGIILFIGSLFFMLLPPLKMTDKDLLNRALYQILTSFILSGVIVYFLLKYLPKNTTFMKLVLADSTSAKEGYVSSISYDEILNKTGIAHTILRPAGIIEIDGKKYDAISVSDFIEKGSKIKVVQVEGIKIFVEQIN
ncbi:MAG TPA: NfeD family protein [Ignavibacteriales bacterium]|nr:NfeD family protein [Ignavibacteriales bacterium]HOM66189.1 NfeD family protein [Ignavibacteriales bacterium]HRR17908.1 NfeD family protein [Ignavibacteriales bacterium]